MTLTGIKVFHYKRFGSGIIINSEKINRNGKADFYVKFCGIEEEKMFEFPGAFINDYLVPQGEESINIINGLINNHLCSMCGKYNYDVDITSDKKYCPECIAEGIVHCVLCKKHIPKKNSIFEYDVNYVGYYCRECNKKIYFCCSECGRNYKLDYLFESEDIISKKKICIACAETYYHSCYSCGRYLEEKDVIKATIKRFSSEHQYDFCSECYEKKVKKCSKCGIVFLSEGSGNNVCDSCNINEEYLEFVKRIDFTQMIKEEYRNFEFMSMKSIDIMTRLRASEDTVIKLNGQRFDLLVLSDRIFGISIVVTYRIPDKYKVYTNIRGEEFTLSEYKKEKYKNLHMYNDSKEENVAFEMPFDESEIIKIFKKPYIMKAKTKFDMNYGDRYYWSGGNLDYVDEGNKYGDTSEFVVIGFIENQN